MSQQTALTLFVTPNRRWYSLLYMHLHQSGLTPFCIVPTAASALDIVHQERPRLVLIDQRLPDYPATDLCSEILAAQPTVKVLMVVESDDQFPLAALRAGAVGSINYHFPPAEWAGVLRYVLNGGMVFNRTVVEALLDQTWTFQKREPVIAIGPLRIDLTRHLVMIAGQYIRLTPREFSLLVCLARNIDRVVTFDQLLNEAWGYQANDGTPAQVRLYIARLRNKLMSDNKTPDFIVTERGIGYRLYSEILSRETTQPSLTVTNSTLYAIAPLLG